MWKVDALNLVGLDVSSFLKTCFEVIVAFLTSTPQRRCSDVCSSGQDEF